MKVQKIEFLQKVRSFVLRVLRKIKRLKKGDQTLKQKKSDIKQFRGLWKRNHTEHFLSNSRKLNRTFVEVIEGQQVGYLLKYIFLQYIY